VLDAMVAQGDLVESQPGKGLAYRVFPIPPLLDRVGDLRPSEADPE
jgi:hypothetical protein